MSRPILSICTRCESPRRKERDRTGEHLYEAVRRLRKERGLKELFKVEEERCLGLCDDPCTIQLEGKKRSTVRRTNVDPVNDVEAVVAAACAYVALSPGEELPERALPGEHAD